MMRPLISFVCFLHACSILSLEAASPTPVFSATLRPGHYTGIIGRHAEVNSNMGGQLDYSVTRSGMASGSLWMDGRKYPVRVARPRMGSSFVTGSVSLKRPKATSLQLIFNETSGSVGERDSGAPTAAIFIGRKHILISTPETGSYTVGFTRSYPLAEGFARLILRRSGSGTWIGRAGDGSAFTSGTHLIAGDLRSNFPLHARLDKDQGSLQGLFTRNTSILDIASTAARLPLDIFLKPRDPLKDRTFATGLTPTAITAIGSRYDRTETIDIFLARSSNYTASSELLFSGLDGLPYPLLFRQYFLVRHPAKVTVPRPGVDNPNKVTLQFNFATGLYTGRYLEKSTGRKGTFYGALVRHSPTLSSRPRSFGQYHMSLGKLDPTHIGTLQWLSLNP